MNKDILSIIAGILFFAGFVPYIFAIFGRTLLFKKIERAQPQKVSWMIWIGLDAITLVGMFLKHSVNGQLIGTIAGGSVVLVLAFIYGKPGWSKVEKTVLEAAMYGAVIGFMLGEPNVTIFINAVILVVGSIPTFISAWSNPENENRMAWTLYFFSCVVALFAIPAWTIEDAVQPISFTIIETTMMYILYLRPRVVAHA